MNRTEIGEFAAMKTDIEHIKCEQVESKRINREEHKLIMDKLDSLDGKFANKWVEKAFITLSIGTIATIIGAVIYLI